MHRLKHREEQANEVLNPTYAHRDFRASVPKYKLPDQGVAADTAYQLVHDTLRLDGSPPLNLASFVTTWMEPQAEKLLMESANKNLIDHEEYAQTASVEQRVTSMTARLFNAPQAEHAYGTTTVGSSEAIMLALLAHKRAWQQRRKAAGLPHAAPNLIFGADAHTCIEKFARYFEVEARMAPMQHGAYTLDADDVASRLDENTIAVCGIAGTTFTGQMDNLKGINDVLTHANDKNAWSVPLHIDAASGGFILPFSRPDLLWDFRLRQVRSINVSNHKFGLVYPGLGTLIFRDQADVPEDLTFHINYLGGDMPNYSLNFSRPSAQLIAQYYNFLRLGHSGYCDVVRNILSNARALAEGLRALGGFKLIGDATLFPVVVATTDDGTDVFELARRLREYGWVVPAYKLPPNAQETAVVRFVVRESMGRDLVENLLHNIKQIRDGVERPKPAKKRLIC